MSDDLKFKHTFTCILIVPSGSRKPSFCIWFVQNIDALRTERDFKGGLIWCYSEKTAVPVQPKRTYFLKWVSRQILKTHMADLAL